ncbi:MAG TPA: hypothetical protein VKB62_15875, partial [Streptosporangiaceae bacterium]|nr:hypothetical protein [Streptosporangiaceae bacterium]
HRADPGKLRNVPHGRVRGHREPGQELLSIPAIIRGVASPAAVAPGGRAAAQNCGADVVYGIGIRSAAVLASRLDT